MQYLAHKIRIYPNAQARSYLAQCFGVSRFSYNWALATSKKHHEDTGKSLAAYDLKKRLNAIKKTEYPWMYEVTKHAPTNAVLDSGKTFVRFFKGQSGHPQFHKKGIKDRFRLSAGSQGIQLQNRVLRRPGDQGFCYFIHRGGAKGAPKEFPGQNKRLWRVIRIW